MYKRHSTPAPINGRRRRPAISPRHFRRSSCIGARSRPHRPPPPPPVPGPIKQPAEVRQMAPLGPPQSRRLLYWTATDRCRKSSSRGATQARRPHSSTTLKWSGRLKGRTADGAAGMVTRHAAGVWHVWRQISDGGRPVVSGLALQMVPGL